MQENIQKNTLTSARRMTIGVCPQCGSENTHSCEKLECVSAIDDEKDSNCPVVLDEGVFNAVVVNISGRHIKSLSQN